MGGRDTKSCGGEKREKTAIPAIADSPRKVLTYITAPLSRIDLGGIREFAFAQIKPLVPEFLVFRRGDRGINELLPVVVILGQNAAIDF